ncbi:MAG: ABC transporter substrate-binding protein [Flavihumibacter sp.]
MNRIVPVRRGWMLAGVILLLAACTNSTSKKKADSSETTAIQHELGITNVPVTPQTIVVLDYSILETLDTLGIRVAGIPKSHVPSYLQRFKDDTTVADLGNPTEVNFEKINALNPDLIIMSARLRTSYEELSKIAPTLYLPIDDNDFMGSFKRNMSVIGKLFHKENIVQAAVDSIDGRLKALNEKTGRLPGKGMIALYTKGKFNVYGKNSRFGILHSVMGIKPSVDSIQNSMFGQAVSSEFIQEANPDYLFIIDRNAAVDKRAAGMAEIENPLIKTTNAYKNGKIIFLDHDYWYLAGGGLISVNKMIDQMNAVF